jgi:SAM-dependent methyltransferase
MPDWNTLFTKEENRWVNPYKDVVEFAESGRLPGNALILDLGSGAGRHLKYLESLHFCTIGLDLAWNGLAASQSSLKDESLPAVLVQADMAHPLPFPDNCFDAIVSIHVIFHNPRRVMQRTLAEMKRVLKRDGVMVVTFNSTLSTRFGKGVKLEEETWLPETGVDKDIPHHFSTLNDVADLMSGFKVLKIRLEERSFEGEVSSHWVVTAKKHQITEDR